MRISRLFHINVIAGTFLFLTSAVSASFASEVVKLTGAGASMPAPLYKR